MLFWVRRVVCKSAWLATQRLALFSKLIVDFIILLCQPLVDENPAAVTPVIGLAWPASYKGKRKDTLPSWKSKIYKKILKKSMVMLTVGASPVMSLPGVGLRYYQETTAKKHHLYIE